MDTLFAEGHRLMVYPYSVRWHLVSPQQLPEGVRHQVLIATSKKKFRHAVDRNRVKRLTRECYRHAKPRLTAFLEDNDLAVVLALNYIHHEIFPFAVLTAKMERIVNTLLKELQGHVEK